MKVRHECEFKAKNNICEFNDKPCPFGDVMECRIYKDEYEKDKQEAKENDYD